MTLLEILAQNTLWIHPKRHLLHYNWLEQGRSLQSSLLSRLLFLLSLSPLGFLALLLRCLCICGGSLDLRYLLLDFGAFFLDGV